MTSQKVSFLIMISGQSANQQFSIPCPNSNQTVTIRFDGPIQFEARFNGSFSIINRGNLPLFGFGNQVQNQPQISQQQQPQPYWMLPKPKDHRDCATPKELPAIHFLEARKAAIKYSTIMHPDTFYLGCVLLGICSSCPF